MGQWSITKNDPLYHITHTRNRVIQFKHLQRHLYWVNFSNYVVFNINSYQTIYLCKIICLNYYLYDKN